MKSTDGFEQCVYALTGIHASNSSTCSVTVSIYIYSEQAVWSSTSDYVFSVEMMLTVRRGFPFNSYLIIITETEEKST